MLERNQRRGEEREGTSSHESRALSGKIPGARLPDCPVSQLFMSYRPLPVSRSRSPHSADLGLVRQRRPLMVGLQGTWRSGSPV